MKTIKRLTWAVVMMALLPSCGVISNATVDDCLWGTAALLSGPFVLARDAHHYRRPVKARVGVR